MTLLRQFQFSDWFPFLRDQFTVSPFQKRVLVAEYERTFKRPVPIGRTAIELEVILMRRKRHQAQQITEKGLAAYGPERWGASVRLMEHVGLNSLEFVEALVTAAGIDRAHEVFHALAGDSQRVAALLAPMSPERRAAAINDLVASMYPGQQESAS